MIPGELQITEILTGLEGSSRSGCQASAHHGIYQPQYHPLLPITPEFFRNAPSQTISQWTAQANTERALTSPPEYHTVHVWAKPPPFNQPATQITALPPVALGASSRGIHRTLVPRRFKCLTPTCQNSFDRSARAEACHNRHMKAQPHVCKGVCGNQNWSVTHFIL
jgi:hypothetical protein